jgi:hypothetical protein
MGFVGYGHDPDPKLGRGFTEEDVVALTSLGIYPDADFERKLDGPVLRQNHARPSRVMKWFIP